MWKMSFISNIENNSMNYQSMQLPVENKAFVCLFYELGSKENFDGLGYKELLKRVSIFID